MKVISVENDHLYQIKSNFPATLKITNNKIQMFDLKCLRKMRQLNAA